MGAVVVVIVNNLLVHLALSNLMRILYFP